MSITYLHVTNNPPDCQQSRAPVTLLYGPLLKRPSELQSFATLELDEI
jgi:hypothetical protein